MYRKWNFSNCLVSVSVVYLWALFPRMAFFARPHWPEGKIEDPSYKEVFDFKHHLVS